MKKLVTSIVQKSTKYATRSIMYLGPNTISTHIQDVKVQNLEEGWEAFLKLWDIEKTGRNKLYASGSAVLWTLDDVEFDWNISDIDLILLQFKDSKDKKEEIDEKSEVQKNFVQLFQTLGWSPILREENERSFGLKRITNSNVDQDIREAFKRAELICFQHDISFLRISVLRYSFDENILLPPISELISLFDFEFVQNYFSKTSCGVRYPNSVQERTSGHPQYLALMNKFYDLKHAIEIRDSMDERVFKYYERGYRIDFKRIMHGQIQEQKQTKERKRKKRAK
jgi:hypothetical protein